MGRRISKAVIKVHYKGLLGNAAISVLGAAGKMINFKSKPGPLLAYNPSAGKLRAWADPFTGTNGTIGVLY